MRLGIPPQALKRRGMIMSTKHTSFIPMSPVQRPQQRLNEVVSIPTLLKGFNPKLEYSEPLRRQPPKGSPRKLTHLFSVEWAWSPMHNRIDNYYLNPRRTDFLLWNNCLNDHTVPWTWSWSWSWDTCLWQSMQNRRQGNSRAFNQGFMGM